MSEKQAKLIRYLVKWTQKTEGPYKIKMLWPILNHKEKGKITRKARHMLATLKAIRERDDRMLATNILQSVAAMDFPKTEENT